MKTYAMILIIRCGYYENLTLREFNNVFFCPLAKQSFATSKSDACEFNSYYISVLAEWLILLIII